MEENCEIAISTFEATMWIFGILATMLITCIWLIYEDYEGEMVFFGTLGFPIVLPMLIINAIYHMISTYAPKKL